MIALEVVDQGLGHLAAAGVASAQNQDFELIGGHGRLQVEVKVKNYDTEVPG